MKVCKYLWLVMLATFIPHATAQIETIRIEGLKRIPRQVILNEARLEEGNTYSDEAVEDAVNRIRRMDTVEWADYNLEAGGNTLVIHVVEHRSFELEAELTSNDGEGSSSYERDVVALRYNRYFAERNLFTSEISSRDAILDDDVQESLSFTLGYQRFGIGTSRIRLEAWGTWTEWDDDLIGIVSAEGQHIWQLSGRSVLPLKRNHELSFAFTVSGREAESSLDREPTDYPTADRYEYETRSKAATLAWDWDTRNDENFETVGAQAGLAFSLTNSDDDTAIRHRILPTDPGVWTYIHADRDLSLVSGHYKRFSSLGKVLTLETGIRGQYLDWDDNVVFNDTEVMIPSNYGLRQSRYDLDLMVHHDIFSRGKGQDCHWRVTGGVAYTFQEWYSHDDIQSVAFKVGTSFRNDFLKIRGEVIYFENI